MAEQIASSARKAGSLLKTLTNDQRTSALKAIHDALRDEKDHVLEANQLDMKLATEANLPESLVKRLDLAKGDKYDAMLQGILDVAALDDPVGNITLSRHLDDGLDLYRVSCPIGVLLVIFEARPEVIANISALALKSGNAAILKGGKESTNTFTIMAKAINKALSKTSIPPNAIQLITTREEVSALLEQDNYIDMVIPRGSNQLVRNIKSNTRIPVLGHADGICSVYVHADADTDMTVRVVTDSKLNYPAACNAVENLLVNNQLLDNREQLLEKTLLSLLQQGVTLRLTEDVSTAVKSIPSLSQYSNKIERATEDDFYTEYTAPILSITSVSSVREAIEHINEHSSKHTDTIITESESTANKFLSGVDSAGVYWNASTRFADGFRYGFGTEVGVSTNRLHARGPVGLEGLMTYQYQIRGHGQVAADYMGAGGKKPFKHENFQVKLSTD